MGKTSKKKTKSRGRQTVARESEACESELPSDAKQGGTLALGHQGDKERIELAAEHIGELSAAELPLALEHAGLSAAKVRRIREWANDRTAPKVEIGHAIDESSTMKQRQAVEKILTTQSAPTVGEFGWLLSDLEGVKVRDPEVRKRLVRKVRYWGELSETELVWNGSIVGSFSVGNRNFDLRTKAGNYTEAEFPPLEVRERDTPGSSGSRVRG